MWTGWWQTWRSSEYQGQGGLGGGLQAQAEPLLPPRIEKREKYSRRRPYNDDADIDYINERNAKFNQKAERFYGKYTAEIKQNLERGTAV